MGYNVTGQGFDPTIGRIEREVRHGDQVWTVSFCREGEWFQGLGMLGFRLFRFNGLIMKV